MTAFSTFSTEDLKKYRDKLKREISAKDNKQQALKIL